MDGCVIEILHLDPVVVSLRAFTCKEMFYHTFRILYPPVDYIRISRHVSSILSMSLLSCLER